MVKNNQDFANLPLHKRVLNFREGCKYLGLAQSYVYKLTSTGIIPFSKPNGKKIYFDRLKLDEWLLSNGSTSDKEKDVAASTHVAINPQ